MRAYQIWERQGRTGNPFDHWHEAEQELKAEETAGTSQNRPEATVEKATPVECEPAPVIDPSQGKRNALT
nr:DUF2934 domain-containing protein [Microvirga calopogonii]